MIPVDQLVTKFGRGDSFAACVASLLERELFAGDGSVVVPRFAADQGWPDISQLRRWLAAEGLTAIRSCEPPGEWLGGARSIAVGRSPRGDLHATVWRGEVLEHDPHPSRAGLATIEETIVLVHVDPSRMRLEVCKLFGLPHPLAPRLAIAALVEGEVRCG